MSAECEEHLKPARSAGGRWHGAMEKAGIAKDKYRIEWGENLQVLCMVGLKKGDIAPKAAEWKATEGWKVYPDIMEKMHGSAIDSGQFGSVSITFEPRPILGG